MLGGLNGLNMPGMGQLPGMGQMPAAHPEIANPEIAFSSQLEQLQAMGFYDAQANIRALQATGGNVSAAVDRLLQQI
jgi:ubiquilin